MQTPPTEPPLNLVRHVDIRDLGVRISKQGLILIRSMIEVVIIKSDLRLAMACGRQGDNPRIEFGCRRCEQRVPERVEKRKVAEVVYAKMLLEAVLC